MSSIPAENFDSAVAALYSQLHQSTTPAALQAAAARRTNTIHDMHTYLHRLGLELNNNSNTDGSSNIPPLIIHITGTKGKGSTLSYCESLLRNAYGLTTGMFTSPHLVCIRERIRINGIPVSTKVFAEAYWTVRRKLEANSHVMFDATTAADGNSQREEESLPPLPTLPGYFRMLTLMALYTFAHHDSPKVDAILLEVGMGGRYDATNVFEPYHNNSNNIKRILVRGITLIDYDHTRVLGSTLEQIAWEKGGIFVSNKMAKINRGDGGYERFLNNHDNEQQEEYEDEEGAGCNSLFVNGSNTPQVANVLRAIAREEKDSSLQLVHDSYLDSIPDLNFHASHQRGNAALALAVCQHAISQYQKQHHNITTLNGVNTKEQISAALNNTFWPGRFHTLTLPSSNDEQVLLKLRCDGAHTPISINACISWFQSIITAYRERTSDDESVRKVLIFNCGHERNPIPLLHSLHRLGLFDCVYFSHADFERPSAMPKQLLDEWLKEEITMTTKPTSGEECAVNYATMCNALKELGIRSSPDVHAENDDMAKSTNTWQQTLASIWRVLDMYHSQVVEKKSDNSCSRDDRTTIVVGLKVADAIDDIRNREAQRQREGRDKKTWVEILVTGSLYLVGSALEAVGWEEGESEGRLHTH